jgi:hypothetical protein
MGQNSDTQSRSRGESRSQLQLDREKIRRVYVRAPNWLGDVIMATAAFARIRSYFIDAEIVCGVKKGHRKILGGCRSFDDYIDAEKARGLSGLRREAAKLRPHRFDLAILFPNSLSSALVCLWAGVPRRLGYTQGRRMLITHGIRADAPKRSDGKRYGPRREPVPDGPLLGGDARRGRHAAGLARARSSS